MEDENNPWMSFSDLLAGLMLLFALLTMFYISKLEKGNNTKAQVFTILAEELKKAGIDPKVNPENGTVEISDTIVFDTNSSTLKSEGKVFLSKVVPALSRAIFTVEGADKEIVSVDIVGYSSQLIRNDVFMNKMMKLSVERSNAVWSYVLADQQIPYHDQFLKKLKVSGWGNIQSTTEEDLSTERKVVFQLQFNNPLVKYSKTQVVKDQVESI